MKTTFKPKAFRWEQVSIILRFLIFIFALMTKAEINGISVSLLVICILIVWSIMEKLIIKSYKAQLK